MIADESPLDSALQRAVADRGGSLQVAAWRDGELVAEASVGAPADAVYPVFSVGKAVVALAVHLQALRGRLELDAPIAVYWPEYAAAGKAAITVRHVLSHRAGVPQAPAGLTPELLGDQEWLAEQLAATTPLYEPGTTNAYMSLTFGWILAEVVRRTDPAHRPLDAFVREELCAPLGADAFWFGVPPEVETRVVELSFPEPPPSSPEGSPALAATPAAVALVPAVFNRPDVHAAGVPAVGAIADARSTAAMFGIYAGAGVAAGTRFASDTSIRDCLTPRPDFDLPDVTYGRRLPVGLGGVWIEAQGVVPQGQDRVLAHPGAGGSVAWAELDSGLSAAILGNRMFTTAAVYPDHPFAEIADAVRKLAGC